MILKVTKKNLRRHFDKLVQRLGTDVDTLKKDGKTISFSEADVPFMKVLLSQFHHKKGIIYEFTTDKSNKKKFSSKEVHDLFQELLDEADKSGMDEEELQQMAAFFQIYFWKVLFDQLNPAMNLSIVSLVTCLACRSLN